MTKILRATFSIPQSKYKSANIPVNWLVGGIKSAWIREYSERVWADAIKDQFGVVALEPKPEDLQVFELSSESKESLKELEELNSKLKDIESERTAHDTKISEYKEWKTQLRQAKKAKKPDEIERLESLIHDYDEKLAVLKASKKRTQSTITSKKRLNSKTTDKELRKVNLAKRKDYIKKKIEANAENHIFQQCFVKVWVSNITAHESDAANSFPTLKAILDGGTDTGILWPDDNNTIIRGGVLFLGAKKSTDKEYKLRVEISSEWDWDEELKPELF
jgi:crossover junction endodeoxyribonuclease RusA